MWTNKKKRAIPWHTITQWCMAGAGRNFFQLKGQRGDMTALQNGVLYIFWLPSQLISVSLNELQGSEGAQAASLLSTALGGHLNWHNLFICNSPRAPVTSPIKHPNHFCYRSIWSSGCYLPSWRLLMAFKVVTCKVPTFITRIFDTAQRSAAIRRQHHYELLFASKVENCTLWLCFLHDKSTSRFPRLGHWAAECEAFSPSSYCSYIFPFSYMWKSLCKVHVFHLFFSWTLDYCPLVRKGWCLMPSSVCKFVCLYF